MDTLGRRLIYARKSEKYTQNALADAIGVSRGVIYNLEKDKNKPQGIVVNAICQTLLIRKEWLLEGVGEMQRETGLSKMLNELLRAAENLPENELTYLLDTIKTVKTHLIEKNAAPTETKKGKEAAVTPGKDLPEPKKTKKEAAETKKEPKKTATESKRGRKAAGETKKEPKKAATESKRGRKAAAETKKEPKKTAAETKKGRKAAGGDAPLTVPPSRETNLRPKTFDFTPPEEPQKTRIYIGANKILPIGRARK